MAALIINDRVKETSTTTGTGTVGLAGASQGFESFTTGIGSDKQTYYCITNSTQTEFEVGVGSVNADVTFVLTVVNPGSGNLYYVDGSRQASINLAEGVKYILQGISVGIACYYLPKKSIASQDVITLALVSSITFAILDMYAPSIEYCNLI